MRPISVIAAALTVAALLVIAGPARAQANRTFVSGSGSDASPCTLAAPCRSFVQALTQTNAGGEITILDPAGYGAVAITKSISIINDGVGEAGVTTASAMIAITVNTGASDVVNLRGLTLVGGGVGIQGVQFTGLGALNIQNCVIRGFSDAGLALEPSGTAAFNVADTVVSDIANIAVSVAPTGSGTVTAVFNRLQVNGARTEGIFVNGAGATGAVNATIANSLVTNSNIGIEAGSAGGKAVTQMAVLNSAASNNVTGVSDSGANSTTYLAKTTIAGNTTAFSVANSGALFSFGDNNVKTNNNDGVVISLVATK
jgi:hypothetical protein